MALNPEMREICNEVAERILREHEKEWIDEQEIEKKLVKEEMEKDLKIVDEDKIKGRVRAKVRKRLKADIESVINQNYGLNKENGLWDIRKKYNKEEVEQFLYVLENMHYQNQRFIYDDEMESNRQRYNKYVFRDLKAGGLKVDYVKYCEWIQEQGIEKKKRNGDNEKEWLDFAKGGQIYFTQISGYYLESVLERTIEKVHEEIFLKTERGDWDALTIYTVIECFIYGFQILMTKALLNEKVSSVNIFLITVNSEIKERKKKYTIAKQTGFNLIQEYAWRLLHQTTVDECRNQTEILKQLEESQSVKLREVSSDEKEMIDRILEWYYKNQYILTELKCDEKLYKWLAYEIFDNKKKFKHKTALVVAKAILNNSYYINGNLAEEVLWLKEKITLIYLFKNRRIEERKEYIKTKKRL